MNGLIRGRLVVGMVTACTITGLFEAFATFRLAHPGVELTLLEDNSDRLIERIRSGAADLALIGTAGDPPHGLNALPILAERLIAAVPTDHPLAKKRQATLADITAYPIMTMPQGTGIRTVFDQACAANGIRPNVALQASAPAAIADLARRGLGIAILTESMVTQDDQRLKAITLSEIKTPALLALIWGTTTSPALRELVKHSREAFQPA